MSINEVNVWNGVVIPPPSGEEPFLLWGRGRRRRTLIILVPSWGETPQSLQPEAAILREKGFTVAVPAYDGEKVVESWEIWNYKYIASLRELFNKPGMKRIKRIILGGVSLGAIFALYSVEAVEDLAYDALGKHVKVVGTCLHSPPLVALQQRLLMTLSSNQLLINVACWIKPTKHFPRHYSPSPLDEYRASKENRPLRAVLVLGQAIRVMVRELKKEKMELPCFVVFSGKESLVNNKLSELLLREIVTGSITVATVDTYHNNALSPFVGDIA